MTEATISAPAVRTDYRHATILACVLCGLLTVVSLLVPPALNFDPGIGMLEWRTLAEGGPANSIMFPDPADISKDHVEFLAWWSPGQYLIPGAFTVLGLPLGPAISVTAGLSLLCCLLGWIRVLKHFAFSPQAATLAVAFLGVFPYSTISFRIYYGGEILLQGVTPWLILAACHIPVASALRAAGLAGLAVLVGFFAKLTGVLVAGAALAAGSIVVLIRLRRITPGMVGGAAGATLAMGLLYATWFSRGPTAASGTGWRLDFTKVVFSAASPWGAGVSWMDMWEQVLLRDPSWIVWILLPPVVFFASAIVWGSRRKMDGRSEPNEFTKFTACFYAIYTLAMEVLFMHAGPAIEERHFRTAGTVIFVCALGVADRLPRKNAIRLAVVSLCGFMAMYGVVSFINRIRSTDMGAIDLYSRTRQFKVDPKALDYARAAFGREGRNALFFLPFPDAASAFPLGARFLSTSLDEVPESLLAARRYAGRVPGHVYVLMRTRLAQSAKGMLVLKEFANYPLDAWEGHEFGDTTVFVQMAPPP